MTARGRLRGAGRLRATRRDLAAGRRRTLRLRPTARAARRVGRRGGRTTVIVRIAARDAAGNVRRVRARSRLA